MDAYAISQNQALTDSQKKAGYLGAATGTAGALGGAKLGAIGGALIGGPFGAVLGGVAGGALGYFGGDALGQYAGSKIWSEEAQKTATAAQEASQAAQEAAKAAQQRPNLTFQYSIQAPITMGPEAGALGMQQMMDRVLRDSLKRAESDARSSMMANPAY